MEHIGRGRSRTRRSPHRSELRRRPIRRRRRRRAAYPPARAAPHRRGAGEGAGHAAADGRGVLGMARTTARAAGRRAERSADALAGEDGDHQRLRPTSPPPLPAPARRRRASAASRRGREHPPARAGRVGDERIALHARRKSARAAGRASARRSAPSPARPARGPALQHGEAHLAGADQRQRHIGQGPLTRCPRFEIGRSRALRARFCRHNTNWNDW